MKTQKNATLGDMPAWRLPSGQAMTEFALQSGFLAPLLLGHGSAAVRRATRPVAGSPVKKSKGGR